MNGRKPAISRIQAHAKESTDPVATPPYARKGRLTGISNSIPQHVKCSKGHAETTEYAFCHLAEVSE